MTKRQRSALAAGLISAAIIATPAGAAPSGPYWGSGGPVWEGYATTTAASSACAGVGGTAVGATHVSVYHPKLNSFDSPSSLSLIFVRAGLTLLNASETASPHMQGNGSYNGVAIDVRSNGFGYSGGSYSLLIAPAAISTSTPLIEISGAIDNFFDVTGCTIKFKGIYTQRID